MTIQKIAVVGTGLMGKGIIHAFAISGYKIDVFGRRDDIAQEFYAYLKNEVTKGRITSEQRDAITGNVNIYNINSDAGVLSNSDLIIETVKEDLKTKEETLSIVSKHASSEAILASNTSSYSISQLADFTPHPANFVGLHFFSPVPLMKLVEVVVGEKADEAVVQTVFKLCSDIGKLPVCVKDSPGFVLNRGLLMLLNEAVYMLSEKTASSAEEIDSIFINGMGMKVGPLKLADLIGIDVVYTSISNMYEGFKNDKYKPCPLLKCMAGEGRIGKKSGEGFYKY